MDHFGTGWGGGGYGGFWLLVGLLLLIALVVLLLPPGPSSGGFQAMPRLVFGAQSVSSSCSLASCARRCSSTRSLCRQTLDRGLGPLRP